MKKHNGGLLALILRVIVIIVAIKIAVSVAQILVGLIGALAWILAVAFVVLVIAIIVSAFLKGDREPAKPPVDTRVKGTGKQEYFNMSPEDAEKIKLANQHMLSARGLSSRIKNMEIRRASEEALLEADKVIKVLKEQPEEIKNARQLINYYLPTLVVVLQKYKKIEDAGVAEQDTVDKLKAYLADIKQALDKLHRALFANEKFDIDVDTEAMRVILKKDGLISEEEIIEASNAIVVYNPEDAK